MASIITPLTAFMGWIWMCYTFGASKFAINAWMSGDMLGSYLEPDALKNWAGVPPIGANILAGIIVVGILSFLHARYIWFPLEPIGFLLATTGHTLVEGIWTTMLVAWVAKTITLRAGGSKAYESYGAPLAAGTIVGTVIAILLGGLISIIRFFIPF